MADKEEKPAQMPEIGTGPGQIPVDALPPSGRSTLRIVRDNLFQTAKKTLDFIDDAEKDKSVKVRVDDRKSTLFLWSALGTVLALLIVVTLLPSLRHIGIVMALVADLLLGASVFWYVVIRFGVLKSLDPRYAVLCFQLLLGTGLMFAYFSINIAMLLLSFVYKWGPV